MQKKYFNSQDARNLINTYGFSIFPIHGVKDDGSCSCNNPECNNIGKHPATPDGFKSASKDIEQIKRLWAGRTGLNVGIATGQESGIFVVDIDDKEAEAELNKLIKLPKTYTVTTGRGKHLYFKYDKNKPVRNGAHVIENVDIRGDGGYVAGAGSNHASGVIYEAVNPLESFADAPQGLYDLITKNKSKEFNSHPTNLFLNTKDGWTIEQVKEHLDHINPDCDYDTWVKIGMALHAEGLPFHLFDDWSKRGIKYDNSTRDHWKSFTAGGGITYGTVVALAKQGGWQFKRESVTAPAPSIKKEVVDPETGEIITPPKRLFYINAPDITAQLDSNDFVQGLLSHGAMSVVYGESNCGKTFFMSDLAYSVVDGRPWNDKRVEKGNVLYVPMEGSYGLKNRIAAHKKERNSDLDGFLMMPCAIDFISEETNDIQEFLDIIEEAKKKLGNINLIVIDTLARAIGGGDENSGQDMGMLVKHADIIRKHTGAHITFIHHSGKDKAKGARGHSSLRAAVDTEIEISRSEGADYSTVRVVKQRDMEMIGDLYFKLERVILGQNKYNEDVTSCIVNYTDEVIAPKEKRLTPIQDFIYTTICDAITEYGMKRRPQKDMAEVICITYTDLHEMLDRKGYKDFMETEKKTTATQVKNATTNARISLKKAGKISFANDYIWLVDNNSDIV